MNRFTADYSSSTASTPKMQPQSRRSIQHYDDTPELASTTPLAPPPSTMFGSSQHGTGVSKLRFAQNARDLPSNPQPKSFGFSTLSQDDYEDEDMEEDDYEEEDLPQTGYTPMQRLFTSNAPYAQSLMKFSAQDAPGPLLKSSRRSTSRLMQYSILPNKGKESFAPGLARDLRRRVSTAELDNDPDLEVVKTEQVLRALSDDAQSADDEALDIILAETAKELEDIWEGSLTHRRRRKDEELAIGPGPGATPFENARFIAVLILRLYNSPRVLEDEDGVKTIPQILLDWLNNHHVTLNFAYAQVAAAEDNVTSSEFFWDVVEGLTARGKLESVVKLLGDADFNYAYREGYSSREKTGYDGIQLQAIQTAAYRVRQVLNQAPSVQSADWKIDGADWIAYRRDIETALEELSQLADAHDDLELIEAEEADDDTNPRRGLPYEVYQHFRNVYSLLLGSSSQLVAVSNDWLEAAVLLTVWWQGEAANKVQQWSFDVSRAQNQAQNGNISLRSYLNRLKDSFLSVTDPTARSNTFNLNPQSPIELAIALTLQGDLSLVLSLVQTYSLCISAALAEMGSWSGWLNMTSVPDGLDKDDLMVLTNGASNAAATKDEILELYANEVFKQGDFETSDRTVIEGWEIAISVISRMDNRTLASRTVHQFLDELPVTSPDRAQRLVTLCSELGLPEESRRVSEQYGDYLVNTSSNYGTALLCYARSQAENKVRQVVDLLNSYCLVQSKAYPSDSEIDPALQQLVSNPKAALAAIAENDPPAAEILQFYLVGYACLRRFYTTRDSTSIEGNKKKIAGRALVAAINSAADGIYGGLYDPSRQSAIVVDGLLPLLGEATALVSEDNQGPRVFNSQQLYAILAAVEDLQTVSDRVYAATEECLAAALRQLQGSRPPSPHAMLKKSMSSGTNSNFSFSMMGSEMLAKSSESLGDRSMGSAVLVGGQQDKLTDKDNVQRGWDWRTAFVGQKINGTDVLRVLRRGIAQELSIANLEEDI